MRLTLRTLLAYLDDILEPSKTKEIGEKVADSSFATSLINRIREVLRRRRLTAPTLSGPGVGIDPNMVAEYLDNTLSAENVADVEKCCLESDMHLAEVAASHQILTLVLGEPVDIVPKSRERMYALPARMTADAARARQVKTAGGPAVQEAPSSSDPNSSTTGIVTAGKATASSAKDEFRHRIPDYLKPRPTWKRAVPYTVVVSVIVLFGLTFFIDGDSEVPGARFVDNSPTPILGIPAPGETQFGTAILPEDPEDRAAAVEDDPFDEGGKAEIAPVAADSFDGEEVAPPAQTDEQSDELLPIDPEAPADAPEEDVSVNVAVVESVTATEADPATLPDPAELIVLQPPTTEGESEDVVEPVESALDLGPLEPLAKAETIVEDGDQVAVIEPDAGKLQPTGKVPRGQKPEPTVQYLSPRGVLLFQGGKDLQWLRLPPRAILYPRDRVVAPEPFAASLRLPKGDTQLTLIGGTSVGFLGATQAAPFTLRINRGRVVFRTGGGAEQESAVIVVIAVGNELWRIELLTGDTVCGLEVLPGQPNQFEQQSATVPYTAALYVSQGAVRFTDGQQLAVQVNDSDWIPLTPGQRPRMNAEGVAEASPPLHTLPQWLRPVGQNAVSERYAKRFEDQFDDDQPVDLSLTATANDRIPGLSHLAVKCLALIEHYPALVQTLARTSHEESRLAAIDGLRDWLLNDPDNRSRLQQELAKVFHQQNAEIVYGLLWGFSREDVQQQLTSQQLINLMGHDHIAVRELAFYHVRRLTNGRNPLGYRPNQSEQHRQSAIDRWQKFVKRNGGLLVPMKR